MNMAKSKKIVSEPITKIMSLDKNKAGRIVSIRLLVILLTDIIVASLFEFVRGEGMREFSFYTNTLPTLRYVFIGLFALALAYYVITLVKKIDTSAHYVTPLMIVAGTFYLAGTAMFYDRLRISPILFYTVTVIVSVLFAVYYVYTVILYKK